MNFTHHLFTPGRVLPWIGGWLDPKAALSVLEKKKNFPLSECNNMADSHGCCSVGLVETTGSNWIALDE